MKLSVIVNHYRTPEILRICLRSIKENLKEADFDWEIILTDVATIEKTSEMMENEFESAKVHLEKYLSYNNLKPISVSQAKRKLESCNFAIVAIKNPVPFDPVNLGDNINTEYDEYWPTLTADEQTLIITRLIPKDLIEDPKSEKEYMV